MRVRVSPFPPPPAASSTTGIVVQGENTWMASRGCEFESRRFHRRRRLPHQHGIVVQRENTWPAPRGCEFESRRFHRLRGPTEGHRKTAKTGTVMNGTRRTCSARSTGGRCSPGMAAQGGVSSGLRMHRASSRKGGAGKRVLPSEFFARVERVIVGLRPPMGFATTPAWGTTKICGYLQR